MDGLPVTDRREFLTFASALGAEAIRPRRLQIAVSAEATVFHAHPEGRASLVRFTVTGSDQPAGRLRAFDRRGALAGTAGMLRAGDRLVGELWLPLDGETRIRSELEMPGTRTPIRTNHTLRPKAKWVISWITLAGPALLTDHLLALPPVRRGAEVARLLRAGVRADPLTDAPDPWTLDQVALLRLPAAAAGVETRFALPMAPAARAAAVVAVPNAALALEGAGIRGVVEAAALPEALGFDRARADMAGRIESWLAAITATDGAHTARATVVGTELVVVDAMRAAVDDWNTTYAYPRIVIGLDDDAVRRATEVVPAPRTFRADVTARELTGIRDARGAVALRRLEETFAPLGRLIAPRRPTLDGIGRAAALPAGGSIVFNPSPFTRSGTVSPWGYATNVPALGYAWLPEPRPRPDDGASRRGETTITNAAFTIALNAETGAVRSVRDVAGREWAHPSGCNVIEHARLDETTLEPVPGGTALTARRVTLRGTVTSTVTLYDDADWIELVNVSTVVGTDPLHYGFRFALPVSLARWEVPGGVQSGGPPVHPSALLRWLALDGADGSIVLAVPDTPAVSIAADGGMTVATGDGHTRILLQPSAVPSEVGPWRLAWRTAPLVAVPATGAGAVAMPTFGRSVGVDEPGVLVAGIKAADDGVGAIVYLQEVLGLAREVALQGELLRFDAALSCDLVERDRATLALSGNSLVRVPLDRYGFSAVRLLGLTLGR